jgi:hypothetical protein
MHMRASLLRSCDSLPLMSLSESKHSAVRQAPAKRTSRQAVSVVDKIIDKKACRQESGVLGSLETWFKPKEEHLRKLLCSGGLQRCDQCLRAHLLSSKLCEEGG